MEQQAHNVPASMCAHEFSILNKLICNNAESISEWVCTAKERIAGRKLGCGLGGGDGPRRSASIAL